MAVPSHSMLLLLPLTLSFLVTPILIFANSCSSTPSTLAMHKVSIDEGKNLPIYESIKLRDLKL